MAVIIGVDPHKATHTAVAIGSGEEELASKKVRSGGSQAGQLLAWAEPFDTRTWAIESAGGLGYLLAQQLVAAGETVVDVPATQRRPAGGAVIRPRCTPGKTPGSDVEHPRLLVAGSVSPRRRHAAPENRSGLSATDRGDGSEAGDPHADYALAADASRSAHARFAPSAPAQLGRPCAATRNVDCAVGETPCLTASDDAGVEDDEAEVVYWGRCPSRCPACRSEALTEAGATTGV